MDNAADKDVQAESKANRRGGAKPESPASFERKVKIAQTKQAKQNSRVIETYYELVHGKKLVLCKRIASGSVRRTLIGSIVEIVGKGMDEQKILNANLRAQIAKLQKNGELKVRA